MKIVNEKIVATFSNILFWNNKLWFTELNCNELYCYDLKNQQVEFFCKFDEEKEYGSYLFGKIIPYKNYLFVIPASATKLYRVNVENRKIKKIPLFIEKWQSDINIAKFISAHILDEKLYLIGAACPLIVEYNCENEEIIYISEELSFMREGNTCNTSIFVRETILIDKTIYIPLCKKNYVGMFDTEKRKISYQKIGIKNYGYASICGKDGEYFWLAPRDDGPIIYWEKKTGLCKEFVFPLDYVPLKSSFSNIVCFENTIWAFPLNTKGIWQVDCNTKQLSLFSKISKEINRVHVCCSKENLFCFSEKENRLYIINNKCDVVNSLQIFLPEENIKYHKNNNYEMKILFEVYQNFQIIKEEETNKLKSYLFWIKNKKYNKIKYGNVKSVGRVIFSELI